MARENSKPLEQEGLDLFSLKLDFRKLGVQLGCKAVWSIRIILTRFEYIRGIMETKIAV